MIRGTVCSNTSTYGSVGALGGQPPRATRLISAKRLRTYFFRSVPRLFRILFAHSEMNDTTEDQKPLNK
jgi:hypothetical protein